MPALPVPRVMDRLSHEMAMRRDLQVRHHSVGKDLVLGLPPSIALPDGEEIPYGSSKRLQIRNNDQVGSACSLALLYCVLQYTGRQAAFFGLCTNRDIRTLHIVGVGGLVG